MNPDRGTDGRPRILFCAPSAYVGGGVAEWLMALTGALESRGWDVVVALSEGRTHHRPERYLARYPHAQTVRMRAMSGLREERHAVILDTIRRCRPAIVLPVHLADVLYAAAHAKRLPIGSRDRFDGRLAVCLHSQHERALVDFTVCAGDIDLGVSVSRRGQVLLADVAGIPAVLTRHIPTGVPAPRTESRRGDSPLELAYVGRLDNHEKRASDLAALMPRLENLDVRVHVVGDGPDGSGLRDALRKEQERGRVVFHGEQPRGYLYESIYPRVHGVLIFSPSEGGPISAWEALVHGVVPVTSRYAGLAEENVLVDGHNCLTFPVGDMARAEAAVCMLANPSLRASLSRQARALPPTYTEAGFGDAWDRELRALLERPSRAGRCPLPRPISPGRLGHWLPFPRMLKTIRCLTVQLPPTLGPGDEWPHVYGVGVRPASSRAAV